MIRWSFGLEVRDGRQCNYASAFACNIFYKQLEGPGQKPEVGRDKVYNKLDCWMHKPCLIVVPLNCCCPMNHEHNHMTLPPRDYSITRD